MRLALVPLTAVALAALLGRPAAAQELEAQAARALKVLRDPAHPPIASLVPGFLTFVRGDPDFLFAILRDGKIPDRGDGEQILSIYQRDLILASFERWGRTGTLGALAAEIGDPHTVRERLATVEILGAVGRGEDLSRLLALALPKEEAAPADAMLDALERASTAILRRDGTAFRRLVQARLSVRPEL